MMIQRKEYLKKLIAFRDKQLIKVVTGVRRCGKSTLLKMYQEWLREQGVEASRIISINFEDIDYEELTDYRKLYDYLKEHLNSESEYSCAGVPLFRRNGYRQSGARKPLFQNRDTAPNCLLPASLLA